MKIHRFWMERLPVAAESSLEQPDLVHQIKDVLQLRPGELIRLFDTTQEREAELLLVSKYEIKIRLGLDISPLPPPPMNIHLAISLLKGDSWDEIIRDCTPLGITDIQPIVCERSIVRDLSPSKIQRFQTIAREATEQSGWTHIPPIHSVTPFTTWLKTTLPEQTVVLHHPGTLLHQSHLPEVVTLVVGPEGGWTGTELALARGMGIQVASLTPATLTARLTPVVACAASLTLSAASHNATKSVY